MKNKKIVSVIVSSIIFIFCIYYIVRFFHWHMIFEALLQTNIRLFVGAVIPSILIYWWLRTLRCYLLLKTVNIHVSFFELYLIGSASMAFAIVTPMQAGEALKIELLRRINSNSFDRASGYGVFLAERFFDLATVLLIAFVSLLFKVAQVVNTQALLVSFIIFIGGVCLLLVIIRQASSHHLLGRFLRPLKLCIRNGKILISVLMLTLASWLFVVIGWNLSLHSVSIPLTYLDTIGLTATTTLIGIMSLIPGALGISEMSIATFLTYLSYEASTAQTGAVILRVYGFLIIVLGLLHYLWLQLMIHRNLSTTSSQQRPLTQPKRPSIARKTTSQ